MLVCIIFLSFILLRDFLYRIFFIYPLVYFNGKYARTIEDRDIVKWVSKEIFLNRVSIGFVGNSHVMDGIDPSVFKNENLNGKIAYNLALYFIPLPNMVEILHKNSCFPDTIVIDFSTRYCHYDKSYNFYEDLLRKKYNLKKDYFLDKLAFILPSLFIPKKFSFLGVRTIKKMIDWKQKGIPSIGRYTPFKLLVGFRWSLNKEFNHRLVLRKKNKTKLERLIELTSLRKSIQQTKLKCNKDLQEYKVGFSIIENYIKEASQRNCKIFFIRLPLHSFLIDHEDKYFNHYFNDIKSLADSYKVRYIDLNTEIVLQQLGDISFYADGQHLDHNSSIKVSKFLLNLIQTNND